MAMHGSWGETSMDLGSQTSGRVRAVTHSCTSSSIATVLPGYVVYGCAVLVPSYTKAVGT